MRKKLLESAPWREEEKSDKFESAKLRATNQPGGTATMYVPAKKSVKSKADVGEGSIEIDPELRYSFQRNVQVSVFNAYFFFSTISGFLIGYVFTAFLQRVFSIDTIVKPLPPAMAYPVARNLSFFTRIFTQFFDHEGVANARKSLGLGEEEKVRRVG